MPERSDEYVGADERFASKIFTDRKRPRIAFWDMYEKARANRKEMLAISFYGIGGEGKTSTLQKLQNEIEEVEYGKPIEAVKQEILDRRSEPLCSAGALTGPKKVCTIPHALYDFNDGTEEVAALRRLADTLSQDYGFRFPFFDIAYYKYTYSGEGKDSAAQKAIERGRSQYLLNHPVVKLCVDAAGLFGHIDFTGIINDVLDLGEKWSSYRSRKKVESKLSALYMVSEKEKVAEFALSYFIQDLKTNMQGQEEPTVLFLDTYERLADYGRNGNFPNIQDAWVRQLIDGVPGLLCVIAGRDRIRWEELEGKEGGIWKEALEQHNLEDLSEEDTDHFLTEMGISDRGIQEQVYGITKGVPVYLDLCVERYDAAMQAGQEVTAEDFGQNLVELTKRYLSDIGSPDMVRFLACLQAWTDSDMRGIRKILDQEGMPISFSQSDYDAMKHQSYVRRDGDSYRMHGLICRLFSSHCSPEFLKGVFLAIFRYYDAKMEGTYFVDPTYQSMKSRYRDAIAGALRDERLMADSGFSSKLLTYLSSFADTLSDHGDYRDALDAGRKAYEGQVRALGEEHPDTLASLSSLAVDYFRLGLYKEALDAQQKAYEGMKRTLGAENPDTLASLSAMASEYSALGRHQEALDAYLEAYEAQTRILGAENPGTLSTLGNMVADYLFLRRYQEALDAQQQVYEAWLRILGAEHPTTLGSLNNMAVCYSDLGRYQEALDADQRVYEARVRILGAEHPETLESLGNVAADYSDLGRYQEALNAQQQVYEALVRVLGAEHPETLTILSNMANDYARLGRYQEALDAYRKVYEARVRILGAEHPATLISLSNMAVDYARLGLYQEALDADRRVYEARKHILGTEHPDTLYSLSAMASDYSDLGRHQEALDADRKAYEVRKRVLGADHPDTQLSEKAVALDISKLA